MKNLNPKILKQVTAFGHEQHLGDSLDKSLWMQVSMDVYQLGYLINSLHGPIQQQHFARELNTLQDLQNRLRSKK
jgi:hypothetical protein